MELVRVKKLASVGDPPVTLSNQVVLVRNCGLASQRWLTDGHATRRNTSGSSVFPGGAGGAGGAGGKGGGVGGTGGKGGDGGGGPAGGTPCTPATTLTVTVLLLT